MLWFINSILAARRRASLHASKHEGETDTMTLEQIKQDGFDLSKRNEENPKYIHVRCSQCACVVVQGIPIHEKGCPNDKTQKRNRYE